MYPMVKIPSSFLLYVCLTIQSFIVPCPIPWPGGCNDRVVMTMVEGDTRVTVRMTSGWWHSVQWPCRHPGLTNQFRQVSPLSPVSPLPTEVHITGLPSTIQISIQYIAICHSMPQLGRLNLNLCCSSLQLVRTCDMMAWPSIILLMSPLFQFLSVPKFIWNNCVTPPAGCCSQPLSGPHSAMTTLQTGTQLSPLCRVIMMAARAGRISQYVAVWGWSVQEMVYCWGTPPGLNWPKQYQYLVNY